jgi:hypothetical protein
MALTKMVNGEVIPISAEEEAEVLQTWANAQKDDPVVFQLKNYPEGNVLFSMLWDSMNAGEIPKSLAFFNAIQAVKNKYPKTS